MTASERRSTRFQIVRLMRRYRADTPAGQRFIKTVMMSSEGRLRGVQVVFFVLDPAYAVATEPGRVRAGVTRWPPATVDERVQITAGILEACVGEFEIQAVVVGHRHLIPRETRPYATAMSRKNVCSHSADYDAPAFRKLKSNAARDTLLASSGWRCRIPPEQAFPRMTPTAAAPHCG